MNILDAKLRQQALDPNTSFIVEAPAGSGKTELLVQRYLSLLASVRHPEEILAITFTRKAAHEMRSRIIRALEAQDSFLAQQILANPNRLCIQTIDAFCMRLTQQMPIISGMGGNAQIAAIPDHIYQKCVACVLDTMDEKTPWQQAIIDVFIHFDNQRNVIETVLIDMLKKRDQWLPYVLSAGDPEKLRLQFEKQLKRMRDKAQKKLDSLFPSDIKQEIAALKPDANIIDLLLTQSNEFRKKVDKSLGFPAPSGIKDKALREIAKDNKDRMEAVLEALRDNEALRLALQHLREAPPAQYSQASWEFLQALLTLLPIMAAQLTVTFSAHGQVDFIEVATRALASLGDEEMPSDLALVLDYQLSHILVDEFQDTSITQFRLLEKMVCTWQKGDGRTLFLVGDPMQSIYRFRQANVGLFLQAKYHGIANVHLTSLQLCMNFRSDPLLIDWINQAMPNIMPKIADIQAGAIPFTQCMPARSAQQDASLACYLLSDAMDEALWLIQEIKKIKSENPSWTIGVLVRARSHLLEILPQFKSANIAYQAVEIEPLARRPGINDLVALTRALLHFHDRVAWLALLRAPWCGISLAEIEILANKDPELALWETIQKEEDPRIRRFTNALMPSLMATARMPLSAWVKSAWVALGARDYSDENAQADAKAYFELLTFLENNYSQVDAHKISAHLETLFTDQIEHDENAVQVMTIHKAKGLEFDAVLIPGLSRRPANSQQPLLRYMQQTQIDGMYWLLAPIHARTAEQDPIYQYLGRLEKQQEQFEMQRLLYVALTRARQQLHLSAVCDLENPAPTPSSLLALLWPFFINQAQKMVFDKPEMHAHMPNTLKRLPLDWQLSSPWHAFLYQTPQEIVTENTVDISVFSPDNVMRRHVGTLLHRILKHMAESNLRFDETRWRTQLMALGVQSNELDLALLLLKQGVAKILADPKGLWILQQHAESYCEYPLDTYHHQEYKRVVIDRTFVDNNIRWIIDYKSSMPQHNESLDDFLARECETYHAQLAHYAQVMQHIDKRDIRLGLYFPLIPAWRELT
jgi:ATP-dependent helicase/nuclease subunit A